MNVTPCCEKCRIYLAYKDAHQCIDGKCQCHIRYDKTDEYFDIAKKRIDSAQEA